LSILALGFYHWKTASKNISYFQVSERPYSLPTSNIKVTTTIGGADIDQPIRDFVGEFNSYIDDCNQTTRRQNKAQAIGYWVASLIAVFSFALVMIS